MRNGTLYFAYGANLNRQGMQFRCPNATPIRAFSMLDFELVFRGVADVVPKNGHAVQGALYQITKACERSLDRFEGFRQGNPRAGMYRKEYFKVRNRTDGTIHEVMYYAMNRGGLRPPCESYLETILQGYEDWGLDPEPLLQTARALEVAGRG